MAGKDCSPSAYAVPGGLFDAFSLGLVLQLVLTVSGLWMNVRSLRVLTDSSVRAHCS